MSLQPLDTPKKDLSFKTACWYWLKLGFISFGGPAGQISMMYQELVEQRRWISEKRFFHALNYTMILPGPEAQQLATYIGWLLHGTWGGIVAGLLFILPAFFLLMIFAWVYICWGELPVIAGILYGIKPAVTAIIFFAAYRIGLRVLKTPWLWIIALSALVAITFFNLPYAFIVISAGLLGYWGSCLYPTAVLPLPINPSLSSKVSPTVIDNDTPLITTTATTKRDSWRWLSIGCLVWLVSIVIIIFYYGTQHVLSQMAWFFTKVALLTFGGAYAALPYIYQAGVMDYQWLSAQQMMDGLALGETTPGPLIMLVTFVGFVGGWQSVSAEHAGWMGILGASVATFFTFLPSFIFILVGAPLIEKTQNNRAFTAPLTGITAAVVGIIIKLGLFFTYHVLYPQGWSGRLDGFSAVLMLIALWGLFRYQWNILILLAGCGTAGVCISFLS
ncbi:chromate transporter, chromate ion transporter family [Beggiatoa alba B18LD]|uniref:Chromate transporter, chromate ion transporter family n=1 Tax=Beggiatoa alba B18LD TaxID=395493 RepID=I3CC62_9GAMM|nr:chromate efflux transporter [Beggiatoa alba]EIJ41205.1 chromate transporter, chromate ion transporter family [Beggiatoa alba B18LD]